MDGDGDTDILSVDVFRDSIHLFENDGAAAIHPPEGTRAILECLGLPSGAPPHALRHFPIPATRLQAQFESPTIRSPPRSPTPTS